MNEQGIRIIEVMMLLILSVWSDTKDFKVRNSITFSAAFVGIITCFIVEGPNGLFQSIQGMMIPLALLFTLYLLRMLGAGDIKLFGAIGAIMGTGFVLNAITCSFLFGGTLSIAIIAMRKNGKQRFIHLYCYLKACFLSMKLLEYQDFQKERDGVFRFSYAIAGGTLLAFGFAAYKIELLPFL
ncbi:MAG: A24 family peptidase [Clostridia bacterium]|nr:A24 family peptidase [Clostridia bacterium]